MKSMPLEVHASASEDDESVDDFVDAEDVVLTTESASGAINPIHPTSTSSSSTNTKLPDLICDVRIQGDSNRSIVALPHPPISEQVQKMLLTDEQVDRELTEDFRLHRAIFERKSVDAVAELLRGWKAKSFKSYADMVAVKDLHGNTPLHLAVMLGLKDLIHLLLTHDAPIKSRNVQGWTPLDESISYGDRKIIKLILKTCRKQARKSLDSRRPKLIKALSLIPDFQMELKWEFASWVPLVKRFLPSDTCRISKKGSSIRLDTTLVDFSDRSWQRGNITFLFVGAKKSSKALTVLDNELKVYQTVKYNDATDIDEDIDMLMSSDIIRPMMSTKNISFSRQYAGWFFSRYYKTEKVGQFEADCYSINGLAIESKKRREHLSEDDVQSNKALIQTLKQSLENSKNKTGGDGLNGDGNPIIYECVDVDDMKTELVNGDGGDAKKGKEEKGKKNKDNKDKEDLGSSSSNSSMTELLLASGKNHVQNGDHYGDDEEDDEEALAAMTKQAQLLQYRRRKSLPPPVTQSASWKEYISAPKGHPPCLARSWKSKESVRTFKATLAMSKDFPLSVESLLNVLEVVAPFKHFNKLRQFIQLNLPPGFPVKIDIPLFPAILARVSFLNFEYNDKISDSLFDIPADYTEDPDRFPDI